MVVRSGGRGVAALVGALACACAHYPSSPAYDEGSRDFALGEPAPGPPAPASDCPDREACLTACDSGDANACTRAGDAAFPGDVDGAQRMWLRACRGRDATGCARLMQTTGEHPRIADAYGVHACAYGDAGACGLLARSLLMRSFAPTGHRTEADLRGAAVAAFERGCELGDWFSCWLASSLLDETGAKRHAKSLRGRANMLAERACASGSADACDVLGRRADRAGDRDEARRRYGEACRLQLAAAVAAHRKALRDEATCARAAELGAVPEQTAITATDPERLERLWAPAEVFAARRVEGEQIAMPPDPVRARLRRSFHRIDATVLVCTTPLGTVEKVQFQHGSGFPQYDRVIFELVRTWRYRPLTIDGERLASCTSVTFIYRD